MRKHIIISLFVAILLILTACVGQPPEAASRAAGTDSIQRVISLGPNITEILVGLDVGDTLVAIDEHSADIPGLPEGLPRLSIMPVDAEQLIALAPEIIFVAGIVQAEGDDPFSVLADTPIVVVHFPAVGDIADIMADIGMIAAMMSVPEAGDAIIAEMQQAIDEIRTIGKTIADRRTVYFEISAAPFMFSFGSGTFLNEMIEIVGAANALANQGEWFFSVADEVILSANPDVILTNISYLDDPIAEIASRPGWWDAMSAVQNGRIYQIPTNASSRPSHHIVEAMRVMAAVIYPEYFNLYGANE